MIFDIIGGTGVFSIILLGIALLIHIPLTATAITIIIGMGFLLTSGIVSSSKPSSNEPNYSNKRRLTADEIERIEKDEREDRIRNWKGYYRCASEELPARYGVDGGFHLFPWEPDVFIYYFGVNKFIDCDEHLYLGVESIGNKIAFGREKDERDQIFGESASVFLVYGSDKNVGFVMYVFRIKEGWSFKLENENPDTDSKIYPSLYKAKIAGLNFKENLFN